MRVTASVWRGTEVLQERRLSVPYRKRCQFGVLEYEIVEIEIASRW